MSERHQHAYMMGHDGKLFCSGCDKEWYPTDVAEHRDELREMVDTLRAELVIAQERITALETALQFYAEAGNYSDGTYGRLYATDVGQDGGKRARAALASTPAVAMDESDQLSLDFETIRAFAIANGGREVHRSWRATMTAQGRFVTPQRQSWNTLSQDDKDLDVTIATEVIQDFVNYVLTHPHSAALASTTPEAPTTVSSP